MDKFASQIRNMAHEIVMEETKSMRMELDTLRKSLVEVKSDLDLYKEAYTMACSRVQLYSQKHDRDWEAYHLRAARTALEPKCECKNGRRGPNCQDYHPREG